MRIFVVSLTTCFSCSNSDRTRPSASILARRRLVSLWFASPSSALWISFLSSFFIAITYLFLPISRNNAPRLASSSSFLPAFALFLGRLLAPERVDVRRQAPPQHLARPVGPHP